MRSLNASPSVELTVLMLAMLSETASIQRRWTDSPDPEMSRLSNTSGRPQCRAQAAVLAVERGEGELVAQAGLGGDDRLAVEVHVVAVLAGGLEGTGDGAAGHRGRPPLAQLGAQRGLEVRPAGEEARGLDVGDVVRGH